MVRQYVGARYVPKFRGLWNETTQYEGLDVVDNGSGTSYIAKKVVPAGTPLTNTEYWFVYGASSGAIIDLQTRMSQAESDIDALENRGKYLVVFGDSWTAPTGSWASILASKMGLSLKNYATNGAGFYATGTGGKTFSDQIDTFLAEQIANEDIACIIIYGGLNDLIASPTDAPDYSYKSLTVTTLNKLSAYTVKKYLFYTNVAMNYMYRGEMFYNEVSKFINANVNEWTIVRALNWLSYWYIGENYYKLDGMHPTDTNGYSWLASVIESVLTIGKSPDRSVSVNCDNGYALISTYKDDIIFLNIDKENGFSGNYTPAGTNFDNLSAVVPYANQLPDNINVISLVNRSTLVNYYILLTRATSTLRLYYPNTSQFAWGDLSENCPAILKGGIQQ